MKSLKGTEARWSEDGLSVTLQDDDGSWRAHLRVESWYEDHQTEAQLAWVASWLDPQAEQPTMLSAAVEIPALTADVPARRRELMELALSAIEQPPKTPKPFAIPPPTPKGADEWARHLDLQLGCWDSAFSELVAACQKTGEGDEFKRYRSLTQALDWAYAMDSSLGVLWRSLPTEVREQASRQTDNRARKAAEHNAASPLKFDLNTDPAFAGYVRRSNDHEPYKHWGELMLAGVFQAQFFDAIAWVRGQLIHAATSAPMDLRQFRPGAEPRWKWRESNLFSRGRSNDAGRRVYDRLLAGRDVVGLLGHLTDIFFEAGMRLRRYLREIEVA